ncbi:hypothetical protein HispidOSU_029663 [Sigmodon hispidus]
MAGSWLRTLEDPEVGLLVKFSEDTASKPFGGKLSPTLTLATEAAHTMDDDLQLLLDGGSNVHIIWDMNLSDIMTCHKEVIQLNFMSPAVGIGDIGQADVHESINTVNSSLG